MLTLLITFASGTQETHQFDASRIMTGPVQASYDQGVIVSAEVISYEPWRIIDG